MIINVTENAQKAIQHVVEQENIENPQVHVYSEVDDQNQTEFKMLLLNGIPKAEDLVFNFDSFKVTVSELSQKDMLGTYLIDFNDEPYSAFSIVEIDK